MLATNHGLTGILLGAYLPLPVAIPLAFASHFVMDTLPHYGIDQNKRNSTTIYKLIVLCDTLVGLAFAAAFAVQHQWKIEITGWVAYSPDAFWVMHYFRNGKDLHIIPKNRFLRFHQNIQKFERPWGMVVDLAVMAVLLPLVLHLLVK